jgi:hypothetical protein
MQVDICAMLFEVYGGEVMRKSSASEWQNCSKRVMRTWKMMKMMLITSLISKVLFTFKCIQQSHTVKQAYYMEILKWLREALSKKRPELWPNNSILYHDNAPAYKVCSVRSSSLWPKNRLLKCNTHPVPLIWL